MSSEESATGAAGGTPRGDGGPDRTAGGGPCPTGPTAAPGREAALRPRRRPPVGRLTSLAVLLLVPPVALGAPVIVNGDLEQVTGGVPDCFSRSGWGDHDVSWSLTSDAHSGTRAQSVTIGNHVSGDRKLIQTEQNACAPEVAPGKSYELSVWYRSTAANNSVTVFRHSGAGWTYWTDIETLPPAAAWTRASAITPPVPPGTDRISFGVSLSGNGTLTTDDYGISEVGATPPTSELTVNPGLEQGGDPPASWFLAGWGDATVDAGVTGDAHGGGRAHRITLSGRTVGDYKLLPTEAAAPRVEPGNVYDLSVWYRSTSAQNNLTLFAHTASGWEYWTDLQTLPPVSAWTRVAVETPAIPAGVDAIAWGVSISGDGTLVTDDYSTTRQGVGEPPPEGPATLGRWTVTDHEMPVRAIHATVLKNGRVLLIAGSGNDLDAFDAGVFTASVWDPATGVFTTLDVPKDMFCAGHVTLPDGRVLIQGGTKSYPSTPTGADYGGLRDSWVFDPDTNTFTTIADANEGHWYPTLTQLGNGDVWMAGGLKEDTSGAVNTERYSVALNRWLPGHQVPQTWSFWGLYPHMFLMQDGRLFYSGGHVFGNGLPGTGASIYDPDAATIADVPGLRSKDMRDQSASVLLPPAQNQEVLITGGGNILGTAPGIALTDIIDLKSPSPGYQPGPDLPGAGKMYVNGTILPDRTVLFSNGGRLNRDDAANVSTAAIFRPESRTMRPVAADPVGRNYHSSAMLLPDGRVAVVGSNPGDGSFEMRISVYEPPYLFGSARPVVSDVPGQVTYGRNFSFAVTSPGGPIRTAQLVRPMSVTHQMDSNMRLVDLPVVVDGGVATVSVPASRNLLPPGPYMLSVTDSNGIPSVARWVTVR